MAEEKGYYGPLQGETIRGKRVLPRSTEQGASDEKAVYGHMVSAMSHSSAAVIHRSYRCAGEADVLKNKEPIGLCSSAFCLRGLITLLLGPFRASGSGVRAWAGRVMTFSVEKKTGEPS